MTQTQLLDALNRSRSVAGFYQAQDEMKAHALRVLKGELIRQHQAELFRVNAGAFVALRQLVYEHFRDVVFPAWDCDRYPDGVYYCDAYAKAQETAWGLKHNESTYRRRLNELAHKRITNPPLLSWTRPGFYVLAEILEGNSK